MIALLAACALAAAQPEPEAPVRGVVDLHSHVASHIPVRAYRPGTGAPLPEDVSWHGRARRRYDEATLRASGITLFLDAAYANPFTIHFHGRARNERVIEAQLAWVDAFAAEHADAFAVARTPEEARAAIAAGRIVFVHAIEGATNLIRTPEQVERWADRGVAALTPIHLSDNHLGSATHTWSYGAVMNLRGKIRRLTGPHRGLKPRGEAVISAMVDAGMIVDVTHMSEYSLADTLDLLEARGAPVLATHTAVRAVRDQRHNLSDAEIGRITALGGLVGLAGNATEMGPRPRRLRQSLDLPEDHCPRSVDDLALHYEHLDRTLPPGVVIAWGSDFQGGVHEYRPRRGPDGCSDRDAAVEGYERVGLAHVGYSSALFDELAARGANTRRLYGSAEAFLQLWEAAREAAAPPSGKPSEVGHPAGSAASSR